MLFDLHFQHMIVCVFRYRSAWDKIKICNGMLIPGGFGDRGTEGKIMAAQYARENDLPFFGICLGFQVVILMCLMFNGDYFDVFDVLYMYFGVLGRCYRVLS